MPGEITNKLITWIYSILYEVRISKIVLYKHMIYVMLDVMKLGIFNNNWGYPKAQRGCGIE